MSTNRRARAASAGFTVIEVLVAFVIAVVGLQLAFGVIGTQGGLLFSAARERDATDWADATLAALGGALPITAGVQQGSLPTGQRWRLAIVPASTPPDQPGWAPRLYQVDLDMSWRSWTGERSLHLTTLKLVSEQVAAQP
jgi:general secretion pathway protein I